MADNTQLAAGAGGDLEATEDLGGRKITEVKIHLGILDQDLGDISAALPLPTQIILGGAIAGTVGNPIFITGGGSMRGTLTDHSGTITAANTAQTPTAANGNRNFLQFQNIGSTDVWFSFTGTAVIGGAGSCLLSAGASWDSTANFLPTQALSLICAVAGQAFTVWEG